MTKSNVFWKVFEATGHIGAYLLYRDYVCAEEGEYFKVSNEEKNAATGGEV